LLVVTRLLFPVPVIAIIAALPRAGFRVIAASDARGAARPDTEEIDRVNELFHTKAVSRLNNQNKGRIVIIAHRLNEDDLSGHVLSKGGWKHLCLPLIALAPETYQTEYGPWYREEGELLRPDAYTREFICEREQDPLFHSIYQQDPDAGNLFRINEQHFPLLTLEPDGKQPLVLSVDPGQANGPDSSYSVIQVWCPQPAIHTGKSLISFSPFRIPLE
jgi:hypothetical protein